MAGLDESQRLHGKWLRENWERNGMSERLFWRSAKAYAARVAVIDGAGEHTYADLMEAARRVAGGLLRGEPVARSLEVSPEETHDLSEARVALLVRPGMGWVAALWGVWLAGGVAVPLAMDAPEPDLEYALEDAGVALMVCNAALAERLGPLAARLGVRLVVLEELMGGEAAEVLPEVDEQRRAMMLYTSGTTSRPKGVVTTHGNVAAQVGALLEAWAWSAEDRIPLFLPLHHVHGIINVVSSALAAGAVVEMMPRFDAGAVWGRMANGELTLLMAVPTIYVRLIAAWEAADEATKSRWSAAAAGLRLMVSGSAALPVTTLERWREITGHTLLERYGMTEIGMALSNPLVGERVAGAVGRPLPGVEVRLVDERGAEVEAGAVGEIEVRGANVFKEYWRRPEATREAFRDGWFRTGDTAVTENGVVRILGRTSVDILKTGGHKVSALEVEEVLRQHESVAECAVVGVADAEWGERIAVALVTHPGAVVELEPLRAWGRSRMAVHKLPTLLRVVEALPRNAMGKVVKPEVKKLFV